MTSPQLSPVPGSRKDATTSVAAAARPEPQAVHTDPVDTAWKIYTSLVDWTSKADTKASFALTVESATLAGILTLSGSGRHLTKLSGFGLNLLYWAGVGLLALAVLCSISAVVPQTRKRHLGREHQQNFFYFGHIRHWTPEDLANEIRRSDLLPVLARQLVVMSQIAWRKYRMVQLSLVSALAGAAFTALAGILT
jgi:hypothetical protein